MGAFVHSVHPSYVQATIQTTNSNHTTQIHQEITVNGKRPASGRITSQAQSSLKQEYKDGVSTEEAIALTMKIMSKTMDSTTLSSEMRIRIICLTFALSTKQPLAKIFKPAEIDALLARARDREERRGCGNGELNGVQFSFYLVGSIALLLSAIAADIRPNIWL